MRIRAYPFTKEVDKFIQKYKQVIVVEMNRDGQMYQLLCMDYPQLAPQLRSDRLPGRPARVRQMDP